MTSPLQQTADIITRAAGWNQALPDDDGVFRFFLEGGLDFELFSPESSTGILLAVLDAVPSENNEQTDNAVRRAASFAAGCMKKRRSVLSIGERGFELYRSFRISDISEPDLLAETRDFLNDLAWWKKQLSGSDSGARAASPFSFSFGDIFSSGAFQG